MIDRWPSKWVYLEVYIYIYILYTPSYTYVYVYIIYISQCIIMYIYIHMSINMIYIYISYIYERGQSCGSNNLDVPWIWRCQMQPSYISAQASEKPQLQLSYNLEELSWVVRVCTATASNYWSCLVVKKIMLQQHVHDVSMMVNHNFR